MEADVIHSTTVICVRKDGAVAMAGDGDQERALPTSSGAKSSELGYANVLPL
jgi:hypothetical protein